MWRAVFYFVVIALAASGLAWFADRPGEITLTWLNYEIETTLLVAAGGIIAALGLLWLMWAALAGIVGAPGLVSGFFKLRRERRGYEALSKGMLAAGAGDMPLAQKYAGQAGRWLAGEPLTLLLKAQAAQLKGDEATATNIFKTMLLIPETSLLGLHGLFVQARRRGDKDAARNFAAQAFARRPSLAWAARAELVAQSAAGEWAAAERTLELARGSKLIEKAEASRKQAVLLCARASELEGRDDDGALNYALRAHKLAPDLVPSATIAGRILAAQGHAIKAARILAKTWRLSPHPDIAEIYGDARSGLAPRDRLTRVRTLVRKHPGGTEGALAIARAAVDARDWRAGRAALAPLLSKALSARVCALMAEIEEGEFGDKGKVREWLSRAVHAPGDPVWTADGFVSEIWRPVSPVTGELDRFEWKVPLATITAGGQPAPDAGVLEIARPGVDVDADADEAQLDDGRAHTADDAKEDETPKATAAISAHDGMIPDGAEAEEAALALDGADERDKPDAKDKAPVMYVAAPAPAPDDPGFDKPKARAWGWFRQFLP